MVAAGTLASGSAARAQDAPDNVRLRQPAERMAVAQAVAGAYRQLARAECQGLLDEFADASGQPLRAVLADQGMEVDVFLSRVLFYDAPPAACQGSALAGTHAPGSRVIRVCGRRFQRTMTDSHRHAEAMVIHEMLHALGLGENPPTSDHITTRVMDRCQG
jgi:hypothetical protein